MSPRERARVAMSSCLAISLVSSAPSVHACEPADDSGEAVSSGPELDLVAPSDLYARALAHREAGEYAAAADLWLQCYAVMPDTLDVLPLRVHVLLSASQAALAEHKANPNVASPR